MPRTGHLLAQVESGLVAGEWGEEHREGFLMSTGGGRGDNAMKALIMVMVAQLCDYNLKTTEYFKRVNCMYVNYI